MIVAESIGFAATHSITEILGELPDYEVSHGSQHFELKHPVGHPPQSPEDFVASMVAAEAAGRTPVAVHTLISPQLLKPACDAAGVDYWLLVREPLAQIESCYAWIARSVLNGQAGHFQQVLQQSLGELTQRKIQANLPNCLFFFACHHVLSFNFIALGMGASPQKMETLMSDEAQFRTAFSVPEDVAIPHFDDASVHSASHRAAADLGALAEPERETIRDTYTLNLGGKTYRLTDMIKLLGY
ncbi:hypothetical protein [Pseudooceanicola sp. MF1-13]|uniref:hypothetical protein n=1 Tax=Pseudooceanicola sp. MF1-13 TaxID=3379095 RepID=UPI003892662D